MSERFSGGFITKTPVTPTSASASGIWTLDQQEQAKQAGNWPFGGPFNYIEDVFSTYLYTGNGTSLSINNGIDLSTNGGMVWNQSRSNTYGGYISDTVRGTGKWIQPFNTNVQATDATAITAFNTNGFTMGSQVGINGGTGQTYASWTFRKQPKFFDVVTYTGNGTAGRTVAHNLGSVPGFMVIKKTSASGSGWACYHISLGATQYIFLNDTGAAATYAGAWQNTTPTSTVFTLGAGGDVNSNGATYVAYLFAHNAGGFGLTGTDNVISCGSFTTDASGNASVTLGYEPQWVLIKAAGGLAEPWFLSDNMRGYGAYSQFGLLLPNSSNAESATSYNVSGVTATGFGWINTNLQASTNYIYIAIRRGPMKVPTDATKVFAPISTYIGSSGQVQTTSVNSTDMFLSRSKSTVSDMRVFDKLRGFSSDSGVTVPVVVTNATAAEFAYGPPIYNVYNNQFLWGPTYPALGVTTPITYALARAPSFFDEVCYTGTGSAQTLTHNLGVAPELMIVKTRSTTGDWPTYTTTTGNQSALYINYNWGVQGPYAGASMWNSTTPTASVFSVGGGGYGSNDSGTTYVAYLFASCLGVSKVGTYTGNGTTQTINCGFTGGARFVLIKRTDSTGDWYVWDTARGMVSGTDPSLLLNSTAAEVNANSIYTTTGGFQIVSTAAGINASGGSYIFLAIA